MSERILFQGRIGGQRLRVWATDAGGGLRILTHEMGPALESAFGKDEIETFLEIDAADTATLVAAVRGELTKPPASSDAIDVIAARYTNDPAATSHLRDLLDARGIPHRFMIV